MGSSHQVSSGTPRSCRRYYRIIALPPRYPDVILLFYYPIIIESPYRSKMKIIVPSLPFITKVQNHFFLSKHLHFYFSSDIILRFFTLSPLKMRGMCLVGKKMRSHKHATPWRLAGNSLKGVLRQGKNRFPVHPPATGKIREKLRRAARSNRSFG